MAPQCSDILLKCYWRSELIDCDKILKVKNTQLGPCCTFNYLQNEDTLTVKQPEYINITGPDMGLIVVVNGSSDDYFYPIFNHCGFNVSSFIFYIQEDVQFNIYFKVQIFNPYEIPDESSGGVSNRIVNLGTETFVSVTGTPIVAVPAVRLYDITQRECLFHDEFSEIFDGFYEQSDCFIRCRMRSIHALCGCIPFYMPVELLHKRDSSFIVTCNLQHIECLHKYSVKWSTVMTKMEDIEGLEKDREESLFCPICLPSCTYHNYHVSVSELPLVRSLRRTAGLT